MFNLHFVALFGALLFLNIFHWRVLTREARMTCACHPLHPIQLSTNKNPSSLLRLWRREERDAVEDADEPPDGNKRQEHRGLGRFSELQPGGAEAEW